MLFRNSVRPLLAFDIGLSVRFAVEVADSTSITHLHGHGDHLRFPPKTAVSLQHVRGRHRTLTNVIQFGNAVRIRIQGPHSYNRTSIEPKKDRKLSGEYHLSDHSDYISSLRQQCDDAIHSLSLLVEEIETLEQDSKRRQALTATKMLADMSLRTFLNACANGALVMNGQVDIADLGFPEFSDSHHYDID